MSQLKLSGDASGTGIVTVAAPNTNSTYTVTLPAAAGTIVTGAAGSTTQVQYNNAGAFGGITNATTDGTTLSMTSPKVITGINDTNGNELLKVTATASAVNELTLANAATGGNPVLSATGGDTNIGVTITPKGTGNLVLTSGNLVVADGKGIDFSATAGTGTSELLSDYEEGTFTPAYNTSNSNMTVTDNGTGTYTKIGRVVHVYMRFLVSAISSAGTGDLRITGLPFTQASGSPNGVVSVIYESNFATNTFPTAGRIDQGKTYIDLYKRSGSDARSALNVSNVAADLAANSGFDWYYACYYV